MDITILPEKSVGFKNNDYKHMVMIIFVVTTRWLSVLIILVTFYED
ncbi:hypothetical protein XIS1_1430041 [Xenorhabdus innexi]|uniref:Uncharacterized protein n=1 Tax=Xenorhabdus innexi TaxID=290109 RepID=A0A1N6MU20_9GAMM|nr:hypothetical protein XIS1_1430041 [Xenorhabdus innexi]